MKNRLFISTFCLTLLLFSCKSKSSLIETAGNGSLKDAYKNDFRIGAAINLEQINESDTKALDLRRNIFTGHINFNLLNQYFVNLFSFYSI
jgi:endo-1,4-beta-xylanase